MWQCKPNKPLPRPKFDNYIREYTLLRPLAKDEKGKILNDTRFDKFEETSKTDLQEYIDSFYDECDIYKILERCARSGDFSILLNDTKEYGDTTPFKDNRPDNDETLKKLQTNYENINADVKAALLAGKSDDEILDIIKNLKTAANQVVDKNLESGDNNA